MTEKVLFVDVDGPLIPARALFLPENLQRTWVEQWRFDPCAVGMLNFLAWAVPDLHAVISSHRVGFAAHVPGLEGLTTLDRAFWEGIFEKNGLQLKLHHDWITPRRVGGDPKVIEIDRWLAKHPEVTTFAVIDDDFNGAEPITPRQVEDYHVVARDYSSGLTYDCLISLARRFSLSPEALTQLYHAYVAEKEALK